MLPPFPAFLTSRPSARLSLLLIQRKGSSSTTLRLPVLLLSHFSAIHRLSYFHSLTRSPQISLFLSSLSRRGNLFALLKDDGNRRRKSYIFCFYRFSLLRLPHYSIFSFTFSLSLLLLRLISIPNVSPFASIFHDRHEHTQHQVLRGNGRGCRSQYCGTICCPESGSCTGSRAHQLRRLSPESGQVFLRQNPLLLEGTGIRILGRRCSWKQG